MSSRRSLQIRHVLLTSAVLTALAATSLSAANQYWNGGKGGTGTWDTLATDLYWNPTNIGATGTGIAPWINNMTSPDAAYFNGTGAVITTDGNLYASTLYINADSYKFFPSANGSTIYLGSSNSGSIVLGGNYLTASKPSVTILSNLVTTGQFVINSGSSSYSKKMTVALAGNNSFGGTIRLIGNAPITLQLGSLVTQDQLSSPVAITALGGSSSSSYPDVSIEANYSEITIDSPSGNDTYGGSQKYIVRTNDFQVNNNIKLNPNHLSNFVVGLGQGSTTDSLTQSYSPLVVETMYHSGFASLNFTGQISGQSDILITNDVWSGGGKGITVFSNANNNFQGRLVINNNGASYQTFVVGAQGAIPTTTDLVFGAGSISLAATGSSTTMTSKSVGAFDLNGYNTTVKSLSTDFGSTSLYALGITNTNNNMNNANLPVAGNTSAPAILTIDSAGDTRNKTFIGNILDGYDFLYYADNSVSGVPSSNPTRHFDTSAGLSVGIKLAATNTGTLTLSANNGSSYNTIYAYTGGTTIAGGSLYVNGILKNSIKAGATPLPVIVQTPLANHISLLGGSGTIIHDVEVQRLATLAPGASATTTGNLKLSKLTLDGGSILSFLFNDGSPTAVAGTGYSTLTVNGAFLESAVTTNNAIKILPNGPFAGFLNYQDATWNLVSFNGTGSILPTELGSTVQLDTTYLPGLAGSYPGTWSLATNGTTLQLRFTHNTNATNLLWSSSQTTGVWDTLATNTIWTDRAHNNASASFSNGGNVNFGNATAATTITIQTAGVNPESVVFSNNSTYAYTLTGGAINGTTGISANGSGRVIVAGANGFTGGTSLYSGGTLETRINNALGADTSIVTIYNGTWNTTLTDQTFNNPLVIAGDPSLGTISAINTATNLTLNGAISGQGTLTKVGTGTLTINGTLTQSGGLNVTAGQLILNSAPSYSSTTSVSTGASLTYNAPANSTINLAPTQQISGDIYINNSVTVSLATGTYSGQGTNGTFHVNGTQTTFQGSGGVAGGAPIAINNNIALNGSNAYDSTNPFRFYLGMSGREGVFTVNGTISGNADVYFGGDPITGGGAATIRLASSNTYTGNTYLTTGGSAVLYLDRDNALPTTTTLILGAQGSGSGSLELNGHSQTLAGLKTDSSGTFGGINSGGAGAIPALTINGSSSTSFDAPISGYLDLNISLQNNATLKLKHTNTYLGYTTVNSGTLIYTKATARPYGDYLYLNADSTTGVGAQVVVQGQAANIAHYRSQLQTGYNNGNWNYSGMQDIYATDDSSDVISSTLAGTSGHLNQGIGYVAGVDYVAINPTTTIANANDIVLKYTWMGDADLDGIITTNDYLQIDSSYLSGQYATGNNATWALGDFNYDGIVNYQDFALIDASLTLSQGHTALVNAQIALDTQRFGTAYLAAYEANLAGTVPEPASLALLGLGAMALLARRK